MARTFGEMLQLDRGFGIQKTPPEPLDYYVSLVRDLLSEEMSRANMWGRSHEINGEKYFVRPSMRLDLNNQPEQFMQHIPVISLEVNGDKIELIGLPMETMALTPEQQKIFQEAGGLMNPPPEVAKADENKDKMMYWTESFENLEATIGGETYSGFSLFKRVYEAYPKIQSMNQEEATAVGLYPFIYYRNFAARKWMAEKMGGSIPTLDRDYCWGMLKDIFDASNGTTNLERLASMGQAPFGLRNPDDACIYNLGIKAIIVADSSCDLSGRVHGLGIPRDYSDRDIWWPYPKKIAVSSIVLLVTPPPPTIVRY